MTHHSTPPNESDEQRLLDFGDRIAAGAAHHPANDLEAILARVHNTLRADNNATTEMPDEIKTHIWEDIMSNVPTPAATVAADRPTAPKPRSFRRQPQQLTAYAPYPRMAWSKAANIALTIVLLLAGFGAFRAFDGELRFGGGGNDTPPTKLPGLAMQPSTPEQQNFAVGPATPQATVQPAFDCDFSADIPIFPGVSQSPVDGTSLYLTPRNEVTGDLTGSLMLHCAEEPEDIELAKDVLSASPGPWQGIVSLSILPEGSTDPADQYPSFLNAFTNQQVPFGTGNEQRFWIQSATDSPWVIGPTIDDLGTIQVVDLRTMEARRLDELSGISTPDNKMAMLSTPADDGTIALGYSGNKYDLRLSRNTGAPGELLILGDSFDDTDWITLDESLPVVSGLKLSPDASRAALILNTNGDTNAYAVVSTDDGSVIVRSGNLPVITDPFLTWMQNGDAIAYASPSTLEVLPAEQNAQPKRVLELGQDIASVRTTPDSDVLVATVRKDHGSDADPASTDVDKVYSVNLSTGDTHDFVGMELGNMIGWGTSVDALLMYDFIGMGEGTVAINVYNPANGEFIRTIPDVPNPHNTGAMTIGKDSFITSPSGATTVYTVGWQNIYVIQQQDGAPAIRLVDPPSEGRGSADVAISPDGSTLSLVNNNDEARTRWLLDLTDPAAEWLKVPNEGVGGGPGTIWLIEGTGD